ncbi:MAG TPA: hypothetical protein PKD33_16550, partial [Rhodocyclaceae bacterium]|nr:hypothetical protein [Rhodocyclaceae bacterium]
MTTRRSFLKACAAAGALMPGLGIGRLAYAATDAAAPLTVVVFLRGGCDGLLLAGPANEPAYVEARPPELRVLDGGERAGLPLANGLTADLDFRLHPDARPLYELYQAGRLALVHAVGLTNGTRSHFEAQDLIERGVSTLEQAYRTPEGWLTRYLTLYGGADGLGVVLLGEVEDRLHRRDPDAGEDERRQDGERDLERRLAVRLLGHRLAPVLEADHGVGDDDHHDHADHTGHQEHRPLQVLDLLCVLALRLPGVLRCVLRAAAQERGDAGATEESVRVDTRSRLAFGHVRLVLTLVRADDGSG